MKVLDLTAKERPSIQYVLTEDITIDVFTPTKAVKELFSSLGEALIKLGKHEATEDDIDTIFDVSAKILSRNKQGISFTKNDLLNLLDTDDVAEILIAYADFLNETITSKN